MKIIESSICHAANVPRTTARGRNTPRHGGFPDPSALLDRLLAESQLTPRGKGGHVRVPPLLLGSRRVPPADQVASSFRSKARAAEMFLSRRGALNDRVMSRKRSCLRWPEGRILTIGGVSHHVCMDRMMLGLDELVEHWTVLDDERDLIAGKRGPTRLGVALLLKFFAQYGRFPSGPVGASGRGHRLRCQAGQGSGVGPGLLRRHCTTGRRHGSPSSRRRSAPTPRAASPRRTARTSTSLASSPWTSRPSTPNSARPAGACHARPGPAAVTAGVAGGSQSAMPIRSPTTGHNGGGLQPLAGWRPLGDRSARDPRWPRRTRGTDPP